VDRFGEGVKMPYSNKNTARGCQFYKQIKANRDRKVHTLLLLDRKEEVHMTVKEAARLLIEIEE
jgi:diphthamide biosynthesis methyltransferase